MGELSNWWHLAWPTCIARLVELLPWFATLMMIGRVGTKELAALSLTESYLYSWMIVPWIGISTTQSTLASQAHGAGNVTAVRGWGLMSLYAQTALAVVVAILWTQSSRVLIAIGFDPELASMGQVYASHAIPNLFLEGFIMAAATHLTSIQVSWLPAAIEALSAGLDIALSYLLIFGKAGLPQLKLEGAALAWTAAGALSFLQCIVAMRWSLGKELWFHEEGEEDEDDALGITAVEDGVTAGSGTGAEDGIDTMDELHGPGRPLLGVDTVERRVVSAGPRTLSHTSRADYTAALSWSTSRAQWRVYMGQALPNLASAALQSWQLQVISFLAAEIGAVDIAAHNAALCLLEVLHTAAEGMSLATSVRIGYHLGNGNVKGAKDAMWVGIAVAGGSAAALAIIGFCARAYMGHIFSTDPQVLDTMAHLAPAFWAVYLLWCTGGQVLATLEGQGRASAQTGAFFVGGWAVALPLAFLSWRFTALGLIGLWGALAVGYAVAAVLAIIAVVRSDWDTLSQQAVAQAMEHKQHEHEEEQGQEEGR